MGKPASSVQSLDPGGNGSPNNIVPAVRYVEPEIESLGNAAQVVEQTSVKGAGTLEGCTSKIDPAYDLDD